MAEITSKEQDKKVQRYRSVFGTIAGRQVLADMIVELGVYSSIDPKDEQRMALRNFGLSLLYNTGILIDRNIDIIVDKLFDIGYIPIDE